MMCLEHTLQSLECVGFGCRLIKTPAQDARKAQRNA
jgi:hypothetical protein